MTTAWHTSHAPARPWRAGAWELEVRDDELADIRYRGLTALRSIRAVVRDHDWNTAAWRVVDTQTTDDTLTLALRTSDAGADIDATLEVTGEPGTLTVAVTATSRIDYLTNRTGLVVLHPPGTAGAPLEVTHPDGTRSAARFPVRISPHQPVKEIAALAWESGGLRVRTEFSGDVFEMEDQRNWTDASFKTYSRPLDLPFPYPLAAGEVVRQRIVVHADPDPDATAAAHADEITLGDAVRMPDVGVAAASAPDPAPQGDDPVDGTLLVELDLATPNWHAALVRAAAAGRPLDARLIVGDDVAPVAEAAAALATVPLTRVGAFRANGHPLQHVSDDALVDAVRDAFGARPGLAVVGGSRSHFTEFNRERSRIPVARLDGVAVTLTPLFHSLTTEQLVESVAIQRLVARQSVEMSEGRPVHIGPVSLRPRFNDVATAVQPAPVATDLDRGYGAQFTGADDARIDDAELAAWTIASAAALSVEGVASISWFEQWGPRGVRTADGAERPVAAALRALTALAGLPVRTGASADGLVWALASPTAVLIANIDDAERRVTIADSRLPGHVRVPAGTARRIDTSESWEDRQ